MRKGVEKIKIQKIFMVSAVLVSAFVLAACSKTAGGNSASNQAPAAVSSSSPESTSVITYTDSGFSPNPINVKVGEAVTFKNVSNSIVQVNSAPHPAHNLYPILNIGSINSGESKSITFTSAGTYKYHNHLNASQNGQIVVQ